MDILNIIREKAFREIISLELMNGSPFQISVKFSDNTTVVYKDNVGLRMWAAMVQHINYIPIEGTTDHCVQTPLGYFKLLGFRSGDAVLFQDAKNVEEPILFS